MNNGAVYLKQNVLAEPLFNQWYAWSYLISPASASMFIANQHLKIMQSFLNSPQVHVSALKNPAMIGGPFINYGEDRAEAIKNLMKVTLTEHKDMIEMAEAVKVLNDILTAEATGTSIEPLYEKVPEILKGYVELVYDLNSYPSGRFLEGLLYRSSHYKPQCQSIALSAIHKDDRSFVFSTPRLEDDDHIHLKTPFCDKALDELFKMKSTPQPYEYIKELLNVPDEKENLFSSLFDKAAPKPAPDRVEDSVRVRYFGHACLLIESKSTTVLLDPVISYKIEGGIERYTYEDLPESIDYVLITHNHQDHCMFETLLQLRHKVKNILLPKNNGGGLADPSLKLVLQNIGFRNVREVDEMESVEFEDGFIMGVPFLGEHGDLNIRTKLAYLISMQDRTILCAADSNNLESKLYKHLAEIVPSLDIVFLGMECDGAPLSWLYGPLITKPLARKMDQSRRFNGSDCERAIGILNHLKPSQIYVYAMGQEPWLTYLTSIKYTESSRPIVESNKLVEHCRTIGIRAERLYGHKEIILN